MAGSPNVLTGTFAGRYTIERELGRGATATVFLARDRQRNRAVAIKLLRPELAQSIGAERFLREIKISERLHHPHIVPVLDSGEVDGQLYFVLPHMEGGSLRQRLEREKQLSIEEAIAITATIADALDYAHAQGLIHRDVKPENILFTSGQACLADFGIARALERAIDESTTSTGLVRGTPAYMSPEQASGSTTYDGRSDQYSLTLVLYEMLAGIPAFIGPTPEAVIAMRFQHKPRDLTVFRATVPTAVEEVISKALSIAAADRYVSAAAFSTALQAASRQPLIARRRSVAGRALHARAPLLIGGITMLILVTAAGLSFGSWRSARLIASLDTARVAVFPFRSDSGEFDQQMHAALHDALRTWQPLDVVSLEDARSAAEAAASTGGITPGQAAKWARNLGARRFIIGRVARSRGGQLVSAEYRDLSSGLLYGVRMEVPHDSAGRTEALHSLMDSLVLRGASLNGAPLPRTRHLYAVQHFLRGMAARDEWDLALADSLFAQAAQFDPSDGRTFLWLAQVRSWLGRKADLWAAAADRAAASPALLPAERPMAVALTALARGEPQRACEAYREMVRADPRSIVGWYGLGECHRADARVVRDARSPSGWRFVASYEQELRAYVTAFELLPATYRAFETGAYSRLRELFFTSSRNLRRGTSADGTAFLGRIALQGDSLVVVPHEMSRVLAGDPRTAAHPAAITRTRQMFQRIATRWAGAFPRSAAAKEALAIALELNGDPAAIDTLTSAAGLATDPLQVLRFRAWLAILRLKFALPADPEGVSAALRAADGLLASVAEPTHAQAQVLAPLAALRGQCTRTAGLLRTAADQTTMAGLPVAADLVGDAHVIHVTLLMECPARPALPSPAAIAARVPTLAASGRSDAVEYQLLGRSVAARYPLDTLWVSRLAGAGDYVIRAQEALSRGDTFMARRILGPALGSRASALPGDFTADAALPEAWLWLHLGDTASAVRVLDAALSQVRHYSPVRPSEPANNAARMAALVSAIRLRATLPADATNDWRSVASVFAAPDN